MRYFVSGSGCDVEILGCFVGSKWDRDWDGIRIPMGRDGTGIPIFLKHGIEVRDGIFCFDIGIGMGC